MSIIAPKILRIDASTRHNGSVSRGLTELAVEVLQDQFGVAHVTQRDMRSGNIPAALKSWIDLICRDNVDGARADNLVGRYKNKQALIILTSNYTIANADDDFATPYLKFMMKFIGIDSVTFVDATGLGNDQAGVSAKAQDAVKNYCMKLAETWDKQTAAE